MSKSNMLQLDPPIPVSSPKGKAQAIGWLDYSPEHHLLWVVAQDSTGEVWIWPNHQIRLRNNPTLERNLTEENHHEID